MTERSEQNDACVAATFAAKSPRALHPVIEIVGERRRAYDDTFRRRVVLASYETGQSVCCCAPVWSPRQRRLPMALETGFCKPVCERAAFFYAGSCDILC